MTPVFEARSVSLGYREKSVLNDVSLSIEKGGITTLVGPNGSGKSTILKAFARLLSAKRGSIILDGQEIARHKTVEVAKRIAILPQQPVVPERLTVRELVEQGRYPHVGALRMLRDTDHDAVREALNLTGMDAFEHRSVDALSGGERQRAWIALTLAQGSSVLLLDEPTTFLDIGHQLEVLDLVSTLNVARSITVVMVLHDLNQAAQYADRMIVLNEGSVYSDGHPNDVFHARMLADVFKVEAKVSTCSETGKPHFIPVRALQKTTATSQRVFSDSQSES